MRARVPGPVVALVLSGLASLAAAAAPARADLLPGSSVPVDDRFAFWEVTECLYVREVDPAYNPGPGSFERFADYDPAERGDALRRKIRTFENSGRVTRPLISVHGTLDTLIPLVHHARDYAARIEALGYGANYRLYEVQNGNHLEAFKAALPALELIQPHAQRAFELLEDWVERGVPAPPSQCVPRGGAISAAPAEASCSSLLVP